MESETLKGKIESIRLEGVTTLLEDGRRVIFNIAHGSLFKDLKEGDDFKAEIKIGHGSMEVTISKI